MLNIIMIIIIDPLAQVWNLTSRLVFVTGQAQRQAAAAVELHGLQLPVRTPQATR